MLKFGGSCGEKIGGVAVEARVYTVGLASCTVGVAPPLLLLLAQDGTLVRSTFYVCICLSYPSHNTAPSLRLAGFSVASFAGPRRVQYSIVKEPPVTILRCGLELRGASRHVLNLRRRETASGATVASASSAHVLVLL